MHLNLFFRWLAIIFVAEGLAMTYAAFGDSDLKFLVLLGLQLFAGIFLIAAVHFCNPAAKPYLHWLAPLVLIAWIATSFTSTRYSTYEAVRFVVQKPSLLRAVSDAKKAKGKSGQVGGCKFETTDALRVYCQDGGMMDHQYGYLYDPTGRVLGINESPDFMSNPISRWFVGNLGSARSIGGDWYYIYFG